MAFLPGKLFETVKIPRERIGALIGTKGKTKRKLEKLAGVELKVDSETGIIGIQGSENAANFYDSVSVVKAIGRGFSPETAFALFDENTLLDELEKLVRGREFAKMEARELPTPAIKPTKAEPIRIIIRKKIGYIDTLRRHIEGLGGIKSPNIVQDLNEIGGYNFKDIQDLRTQTGEIKDFVLSLKKDISQEIRGKRFTIKQFVRGIKMGERAGIKKGAKEARIAILEKIKNQQGKVEDIKQEITTYAKVFLRPDVRGQLLITIRDAKTFKDLEKAKDRIAEIGEKADARKLRKQIIKEFKKTKIIKQAGKPTGKFTPFIQDVLNQIKEAVKLTDEQAEFVINHNLEKYQDIIPPDFVALQNKILSKFSDLQEKDSAELQEIFDVILQIKNKGLLTAELKKFNRETDIGIWVAQAINVITGGKGLPPNINTIGVKELKPENNFEKAKKFLGTIGKSIVGWDDILDMLGRKIKAEPGTTFLDKFGAVEDQENAVKQGRIEYFGGEGILRKIAMESYNIKKDRELVKKFQDDAEEISLGVFNNADGVSTELVFTKSQARKRWMEFQDPSLRETFEVGMKYTDEMFKAIDDFLTLEDKKFAEAQLKFYQNYYGTINPIYTSIYGVNLPQNPKYSPISREGISREESEGFGEFMQEISIRKSVSSGSLKSRVANIKPIRQRSDIAIIEQHIAEMEHFKAWAEKVRDLKAVFGNTDVRAAIIREHGSGMLRVVDNFLNDFTRGGTEMASRLNWLDKLRGNFTRSILAVKPSIGIKQLTSFITYADAIPVKDFAAGTIDFWKHPIERTKILRSSTMMKVRGEYMERDIKTAMRSEVYASWKKHPSFLNTLMLNMKVGDQGAIVMGGWSVYRYHRNQGKTHEEAIKIFEKITSNTQQSGDLSKLSQWQRGGSFAKLFTMFKSAPNQFFRKELGAIRNRFHGRTNNRQFIKTIIIFHFLIPMFFQWVSDWFKWDKKEQLRAAIFGSFNGIFIISDMLEVMIRYAMKMRVFPAEVPIMGIGDDFGKALKLISDDDITTEDVFNAIRGLAGAVGVIKGMPLKQPLDIGKGVVDVLDGEYEYGLGEMLGYSPYTVRQKDKPRKEVGGIQFNFGGEQKIKGIRPLKFNFIK